MYKTTMGLSETGKSVLLYTLLIVGLIGVLPVQSAAQASLSCNLTSNENPILFDEHIRDYIKPEFTMTATLVNTGSVNLTNITAELQYYPTEYIEPDPAAGPFVNPQTFPVLFPGESIKVQWHFRLTKPNMMGHSHYIESDVVYGSSETPLVSQICTHILEIRPVLTPEIICSLQAPVDTITFPYDSYTPNPFQVNLRVEDIGNGQAFNVRAYAAASKGVTLASMNPPSLNLGTIRPGNANDFGDNNGFSFEALPREFDGYDTVRVLVVADNIGPALCEIPIFIEAEKRPVLEVQCTLDSRLPLSFDELLNDYTPNPFEITTMVTNTGNSVVRHCEVYLTAPAYITPFGQHPIQSLPDLLPGDTAWFTWQAMALPQEEASVATMSFEARGRGGMDNDIVLAFCEFEIAIPPIVSAEYQLECDLPELTFDISRGTYSPDPFKFTVDISNIGVVAGQDIELEVSWSGPAVMGISDIPVRTIKILDPAKTQTITWHFNGINTPVDDSLIICVKLKDRFNNEATCCAGTVIPAAAVATLTLECSAQFKSLPVNQSKGDYTVNPFEVYLNVRNDGASPADSVWGVIRPLTKDLLPVCNPNGNPSSTFFIAARMAPGEEIPLNLRTWIVQAIPRLQSGIVEIQFVVRAQGLATVECRVPIDIPAIGRPALDCHIRSSVDDDKVLNYDESINDYEGTPGMDGSNVFSIKVHVNNLGEAQANNTAAILLLPPGIIIDEGEELHKAITPQSLPAGIGNGTATWRLKALRWEKDALRNFRVRVMAENSDISWCDYEITVEGTPPSTASISIPKDNIGNFGALLSVPVVLDSSFGAEISNFMLNVRYDATLLRFAGATNEGTLLEGSWHWPWPRVFDVGNDYKVVRIADGTGGAPIAQMRGGALCYLMFEALAGGTSADFIQTNLQMDTVKQFSYSGVDYLSSLNTYVDSQPGNMKLSLHDGLVSISRNGIRLVRRISAPGLAQNIPNPFNPTTVIAYTLSEAVPVKLEVFDALGRHVRTLVDEYRAAGNYRVRFDAGTLPSGIYLYKLETAGHSEMKRMVLAR